MKKEFNIIGNICNFVKSKNKLELIIIIVLFFINFVFYVCVQLPTYILPFHNVLSQMFSFLTFFIIFGLYFFCNVHPKVLKHLHYLLVFSYSLNNIFYLYLPNIQLGSFLISCIFILSLSLIVEYTTLTHIYFRNLSPLASIDFKSSLLKLGKLSLSIICLISSLYLLNIFLTTLSF